MRRLAVCSLLLAPLALLTLPSFGTSTGVQEPAEVQEGPTPLQEAMGMLQKNQRKLRKLVADPAANADALKAALSEMENGCLLAIANPPTPREDIAEPAPWVVNYKRAMTATLDTVLRMQAATLAGNAEELGAAYSELNQAKKSGHDTYQ